MLVLAVETSPVSSGLVVWSGRRHDDGPELSSGSGPELFDVVFHALHDGEQVALGVDCPLTLGLADGERVSADGGVGEWVRARLADSTQRHPAMAQMTDLLGQLGMWRPWTAVSTSLARWFATRSLLVWQAAGTGSGEVPAAGAAVAAFFDLVGSRADRPPEHGAGGVLNLAAAAALEAGVTADRVELTVPALTVHVSPTQV